MSRSEQKHAALQQSHTALARHEVEFQSVDAGDPLRRAALNLMEDAVHARQAAEKLNAELRESEERFRVLFELGPVGVFSCDKDGVLQQYNRKAAELWGREPRRGDRSERFCGSLKLCRPDGSVLPHAESPIVQVLASGEMVKDVEVGIERPDGSHIIVSVTFAPLKNAAGEVTGAITAFQDVTERQRLQDIERNSERRLRFVMDSAPQKIFTAKPNGDVDYFNPQWTEFTGLSFEQIKDWGWKQFIHPDDVAENVRIWQRSIETGEPFQFEHRFRRADGEYRWHLSRAVPLRDAAARVVMWVGSNTDIHEQLETAHTLRQFTADLFEADRRKNEFLAMLAHELRNPLAPIRNALQIMRLADRDAAGSASTMLERQVGQMVRLVDDLLDVSRISRGKIELRKSSVELASIVHHAVEAARPLSDSMGHELTVTLPPEPMYMEGDPTRLAQVVGNLLNNASKYSPNRGRIWLAVDRQADAAVIRVRDTGIGISAEHLPRIFDMFMQVDTSLERSTSGLGIGLTLVKNLVEMHGGTVEVHSAGVGRGSEFIVRLPLLAEPLPAGADAILGAPTVTTHCRILVVDDNRDAAESLVMLLTLTGNEMRAAYDGIEAVEAAATFSPQVVLLDIGLPKLNGYEVARKLRAQPGGKDMLLIALTGWGQDEDRRKSKEAGFDAHLVKPVDHVALQELLAELGHR